MITGELKSQVDKIWEAFWTGGISNPLSVIEQFTYHSECNTLKRKLNLNPNPTRLIENLRSKFLSHVPSLGSGTLGQS